MHGLRVVTLTLERVFDIVPPQGRDPCTHFGFESQGRRHFNLELQGRPRLEPGMRVTAVILVRGGGLRLQGWVDHATGQLEQRSFRNDEMLLLMGLALASMSGVMIASPAGLLGLVPLGFGLAISLHQLRQCRQNCTSLKLLRRIAQRRDAAPAAGDGPTQERHH